MFINWCNQSQSVLARSLEHTMLIYPTYTYIYTPYIQLHSYIQSNSIQQAHTHICTFTMYGKDCKLKSELSEKSLFCETQSESKRLSHYEVYIFIYRLQMNQTSKDLDINHCGFIYRHARFRQKSLRWYKSLLFSTIFQWGEREREREKHEKQQLIFILYEEKNMFS